jgi:hypothetical protein
VHVLVLDAHFLALPLELLSKSTPCIVRTGLWFYPLLLGPRHGMC